jgi:glycosyltransferase involved in cell wall biosynthesis
MSLKNLKIALVCDWLTNSGGAEKVILALHQLFPKAPIYTSIYNPDRMPGFEHAVVHTSYLQRMPWAKHKHQLYLEFMPSVFERFDLSAYDLVISSSHSCAKGIITKPDTLHVCYCHSPMRYAWENSHAYIREYEIHPFVKMLAPLFMHGIRMWDKISAERVDYFIANSKHIQNRIYKYYRRTSSVIHPFVDTQKFRAGTRRENFYLAVGRLTPYKKFDLIIEAFNKLNLPLKIVGTGVAYRKLAQMANPNVEFHGRVSDETLRDLYGRAKGFIFPQVEDFGITPLEAMASGCPVIAYAGGGALETVIDKKTGIFFKEQNPLSLIGAVEKFQTMKFDPLLIRKHAESFDRKIFNEKILDFLEKKWETWQKEMTLK